MVFGEDERLQEVIEAIIGNKMLFNKLYISGVRIIWTMFWSPKLHFSYSMFPQWMQHSRSGPRGVGVVVVVELAAV